MAERPPIWGRVQVKMPSSFVPPDADPVLFGHGGRGETSWIMHVVPEAVRMEALADMPRPLPDWLHDSHEATAETGRRWFQACVDSWVKELTRSA